MKETTKTETLPLKITIGDKYGPAMEMTEQTDADAYFVKCVEHNQRCQKAEGKKPDVVEAERVEKMNLGYYAGYYDSAIRERVERLFKCAHPYFGAIATNGQPTAETAFNIGAAIGRGMRGR